ncbi:hypothetical protein PIB30_036363 [Stylosanthes scabra]|uniref:SET domain-containing protein n=1 Tax=Stylosanthes scabra TaxID=79078 RepID=A0ABU6YE11_9FABA|nr:hypothetical protein [Stylosanthes scabra]
MKHLLEKGYAVNVRDPRELNVFRVELTIEDFVGPIAAVGVSASCPRTTHLWLKQRITRRFTHLITPFTISFHVGFGLSLSPSVIYLHSLQVLQYSPAPLPISLVDTNCKNLYLEIETKFVDNCSRVVKNGVEIPIVRLAIIEAKPLILYLSVDLFAKSIYGGVLMDGCGFTIDASQYGNEGRFINHSCSPNLYAHNVFYDHHEKRYLKYMFFAAENIPSPQGLT